MTLQGHTALVTGGTTGIGRGIALELARQGARVAVNYRRQGAAVRDTLAALEEVGTPHLAVAADVRVPGEVRAMVEEVTNRLGSLDILVNNAGVGCEGSLVDVSEDAWDLTMDTNLKGPYLCAQAAAPGMIARGWGRIVNITSTNSIRVVPGTSVYCISKAGLAMFTECLAVDLGRHGITVNGVGPSTVPTAMNRDDLARPGKREAEERANPTGRIGTPRDIASAVAFLASEEASWINGQNLMVDGGLTVVLARPA